MQRFAAGALTVAIIGLIIMNASHNTALDVFGAVLLVLGGVCEVVATIYIVATRGLFGGRNR